MRTLKYAILGLINRQPLTGYDLAKEFNRELVNFWYAEHSQIYPELKKLTDEGLISYETVIQGEKMEKKLYSITEAGRRDLLKWLIKEDPLGPTPKDIFKLKVYFADGLTREQLLAQFESQLAKRRKKLAFLEGFMAKHNVAQDCSNVTSPGFGDYVCLYGAILRETAYIDWLNHCIAKIKADG